MIGAIIGDIAGSRFEGRNMLRKDFDLWGAGTTYTDDTVMTLAICEALLQSEADYADFGVRVVEAMQKYGRAEPHRGYGGFFRVWLQAADPQPYNSFGNGSAMRAGGCGWAAQSLQEAQDLARAASEVTHNHPDGIRGAQAVATTIFLARTGADKETLRENFLKYYPLDFTLDGIRGHYRFDVSCAGSVPQAFQAFYESHDFEDAVRGAISIGGDSDTIASMAGTMAEAYYGVPDDLRRRAEEYLGEPLWERLREFEQRFPAEQP